jgi:hypothetical protein
MAESAVLLIFQFLRRLSAYSASSDCQRSLLLLKNTWLVFPVSGDYTYMPR